MTYDIRDFEEDQDKFNLISGAAYRYNKVDLNNQLLLIKEEVDEIAKGIREDNEVEILDGAVDTLFVVLGFIQKLKMAGFLTYEAMQRVAKNNLTKFPKDTKTVLKSIEHYREQGINCTAEYNEEFDCYVIRDQNDKVRKPLGYTSVDISDCVNGNN